MTAGKKDKMCPGFFCPLVLEGREKEGGITFGIYQKPPPLLKEKKEQEGGSKNLK